VLVAAGVGDLGGAQGCWPAVSTAHRW
jgi:hypothetical protein